MAIRLPEICLSLGVSNRVIAFDLTLWLGSEYTLVSGTVTESGSSDVTIGAVMANESAYVDRLTGDTVAAGKALLWPVTIADADTLPAGIRNLLITPTDDSTPAQSEPFILPINFR